MHCVIGSGPAGTACAKALLQRGAEVLMLDAGLELEPERARIPRKLASTNPSQWPREIVEELKSGMNVSARGLPQKLVFGSNYPYREAEEHAAWSGRGASVRPSLALGGFSAVWGAAMLPYRDDDIENWPVKSRELAPHYRAVLEFTGLAAQLDDLDEFFPLHCENPAPLQPSLQALSLLKNLERHRAALRESGWRFGRARLAVRAAGDSKGPGCVYCRLCLYGCPYGCIYNSADTIREMRAGPRFNYQRDVIATALREQSGKVIIEALHRQTRRPLAFEADRAYLAAGIVPTARILLRSQNAYDRPLRARDSQYFVFPLVAAKRASDVQAEMLYTLSQLFIELNNPKISRRTVHLQIYTYNDIAAQAVRKSLGPLKMFARPIEERILIAQGYLHSDDSPEIEMTLKRDGEKDVLQLEARPNPKTRRAVKRVLGEFMRNARRLGAAPVTPMLQMALPGQGFHSGGTFPMREQPGEFESDRLGRPRGWSRVHAVDATVFPSVPATTITLPVMANAHRIGWEAAALD
jgi:choline dehydrogenase-like flavoprotein